MLQLNMLLKYISFIVVLVVLLLSTYEAQSTCNKTPFIHFDYFVLVISNQNTFCYNNNNCRTNKLLSFNQNNKWFTTHGLWPQLLNPVNIRDYPANYFNCPVAYPLKCTNEPFNNNLLDEGLRSRMDEEAWQRVANPDFWGHEWRRHGTCALNSINPGSFIHSQYQYFKNTVDLFYNVNINQKLLQSNIVPNDQVAIQINRLNRALSMNVTPKYRYKSIGGRKYLYEIWYCVSKSGVFIQCPSSLHVNNVASPEDSLIIPTFSFARPWVV